ncbi:O-fucosyltransferase 8 isoform X1 [Lycium barbarum]|uniref:O-fucosyltransferase 8 isoform X1 n=1 Tax=Lycium barbarum TaxID=112863 RepID=UPI00293F3913|nr:O-fucosyltransferase 8 isoform X1 [Lycium barbarum]
MGKQGSPRGRRVENQDLDISFGVKEHEFRSLDMQHGGYPPVGRRLSGGEFKWDKVFLAKGLKNDSAKFTPSKGVYVGKRQMWWLHRHIRSIVFTLLLMGFLYLLDSLLFSIFDPVMLRNNFSLQGSSKTEVDMVPRAVKEDPVKLYERLLNLADSSLAEREFKQESSKLWEEPYPQASSWKPCADKASPHVVRAGKPRNITGYILISANGGLNQQRVAICNAVAVASLLNATLVIPKFLYSNVWKDPSQFGDIYQEDYFMDMLKDEVNIIKELPLNLKLLDVEAAGSLITDADLSKEAKPDEYIKNILPLLLRNRVVHFLGYGNRLGFDPLPYELQRLRCKCNFHALKFVPKIQQIGSLLVRRIRKYDFARSTLDKQLLGNLIPHVPLGSNHHGAEGPSSKYLALHLRFEIDMVAYSMCEFGGGETERRELQTYREAHFPLLLERLKESKPLSPEELRMTGKCPLTPEEAALVLAGLGFKHGTYIYLAGSDIYGGQSRMQALTTLYPNLVTKENLLTSSELAPFRNFSSQLAALDFIACATSDVFAITDSGSQLSSLVSGFRTYYGGGHAPTLRPSKKRLAAILSRNKTIGWHSFEGKIRKMIDEGQRLHVRGLGRSIYRHPRCKECMCRH